ncbi:ATPase, T2SS/T4P/T4SS family [Candidatus Viridilinea mediisalina]|uniref:Bacterial type II secretion system protein E domain-containing protein n=1 Tax=Candidatus Viridilinea mediisalina TaxID=2024553 RepID=A0A2A6RGT4_9CHLR|nr:ATPase, T2SS/T4P/T4SS family [Candidatus Viridilinea mediisalina]PDW02277.1 hypothetical protein CJ255_14705 [Candidatus Viridilinea mediisalina]
MTTGVLRVVEDGGLGSLIGTPAGGGVAGAFVRSPDLLRAVRDLLLDELPKELIDPVAPSAARNAAVLTVLRRAIGEQIEAGEGALRAVPTDEATLLGLYRDSLGWGPAQVYLDDERIQEIKINGTQILVQEDGADFVCVPERFSDPKQVLDRAQVLASQFRVALDAVRPQGTLPLPHGTRMHVTIPPCTPHQQALVCIRRGRRYAWELDDILRRGGFNEAIHALLLLFARAKCSFLIAGETGSGKTALLESIINSWPGTPHVITIEDNTLEIMVRHEAWTRELVQTAYEPTAFGRAAKEALRQTPTIVAPGEIRADEAGAVLTIAVSGHAIISTLHAKSCLAAIQRFADCAAMPGAYVYDGRRDNALEDACDNLEVVIHVEKMAGRRFISEIVLLDGSEPRTANTPLRPRLVPVAQMRVSEQGQIVWDTLVRAEGDTLEWQDGVDRTPKGLNQKLLLLRAAGRVRAAPTTRAAVDEALQRAHELVLAGQIDAAMHALRRAWADRRDPLLVGAMARTLEAEPQRMASASAASEQHAEVVQRLLDARWWGEARAELDHAQADLVTVAALTPAGRWERMAAQITVGLEHDRDLLARARTARSALQRGTHPQEVLTLLGANTVGSCSPDAGMEALTVRRDALRQLIQMGEGEGGKDALAATEAQIAALHAQGQGKPIADSR